MLITWALVAASLDFRRAKPELVPLKFSTFASRFSDTTNGHSLPHLLVGQKHSSVRLTPLVLGSILPTLTFKATLLFR